MLGVLFFLSIDFLLKSFSDWHRLPAYPALSVLSLPASEKRFEKQPVNEVAEERPSSSEALDMRKEYRAVGLLLYPKSNHKAKQ